MDAKFVLLVERRWFLEKPENKQRKLNQNVSRKNTLRERQNAKLIFMFACGQHQFTRTCFVVLKIPCSWLVALKNSVFLVRDATSCFCFVITIKSGVLETDRSYFLFSNCSLSSRSIKSCIFRVASPYRPLSILVLIGHISGYAPRLTIIITLQNKSRVFRWIR